MAGPDNWGGGLGTVLADDGWGFVRDGFDGRVWYGWFLFPHGSGEGGLLVRDDG